MRAEPPQIDYSQHPKSIYQHHCQKSPYRINILQENIAKDVKILIPPVLNPTVRIPIYIREFAS